MEFEETSRPPTRSLWIGAGALILGLWAMTLWAWLSAEADPLAIQTIVVEPLVSAEVDDTRDLLSMNAFLEAAANAMNPPLEEEEPEDNSLGQGRGAELLKLRFIDREKQGEVALRDVFIPRTITVVNVWATWCGPCKAEFKDFAQLWRRWGDEVNFVPVELAPLFERESEERWQARADLHSMMPESQHHLIDASERAIQDAVVEIGLVAPDRVNVPITLVFDCKQKLIWHSFSQITELEVFAAVIEELRPALSTAACYVPPIRREEVGAEVVGEGPKCGDGQCTVKSGEDCHTCSLDCACLGGHVCIKREASSLQPGSAGYICDSPSPLLP